LRPIQLVIGGYRALAGFHALCAAIHWAAFQNNPPLGTCRQLP
jgi:hypothetical protein